MPKNLAMHTGTIQKLVNPAGARGTAWCAARPESCRKASLAGTWTVLGCVHAWQTRKSTVMKPTALLLVIVLARGASAASGSGGSRVRSLDIKVNVGCVISRRANR